MVEENDSKNCYIHDRGLKMAKLEPIPSLIIMESYRINVQMIFVRPLLIIGVERNYLRGTICVVPSLTAVLYTSAVYMCTCVPVCLACVAGRSFNT